MKTTMKLLGSSGVEPIVNAAKGALIGAANTIPGVSGGTMALIVGVYERLVSAIAALDPGDDDA